MATNEPTISVANRAIDVFVSELEAALEDFSVQNDDEDRPKESLRGIGHLANALRAFNPNASDPKSKEKLILELNDALDDQIMGNVVSCLGDLIEGVRRLREQWATRSSA